MSLWSKYFITIVVVLAGGALVPAACGGKSDDEIEAELAAKKKGGDPAAIKKANEIFTSRCVPCHGAEGKGDGSGSAGLNPKPRNFQDPEWQKSVTDEHIMNIIKVGGAGVGKSAAMPSNPDIQDKAVLAALKDHVRSLAKK